MDGHFFKHMTTKISEIEVVYRPAIGRKPVIESSLDAYVELKNFYNESTISLRESFYVMYLNQRNRVLGVYPHSDGGITGTVCDPRIILSVALKVAAVGVILSHNHPSGNLSPSKADKELTEKIKEGGKLLEIKLLDHIILSSEGGYYSFADEGNL